MHAQVHEHLLNTSRHLNRILHRHELRNVMRKVSKLTSSRDMCKSPVRSFLQVRKRELTFNHVDRRDFLSLDKFLQSPNILMTPAH